MRWAVWPTVSTVGRLLIEDGRLAVAALLTAEDGGGRVVAATGSFGKLSILTGSVMGIGSPGL